MATRPIKELTEEMLVKAAGEGMSYAMAARKLNFIQDRMRMWCQLVYPEIHARFVENGRRRMSEAGSKTCEDRRARGEDVRY